MSYMHISLSRLLLSAALIALAVVLSRKGRLGLERDLLWGALRGAAQLIAMGTCCSCSSTMSIRPGWSSCSRSC